MFSYRVYVAGIAITAALTAGCVTTPKYLGPGDQNAFAQARYQCLQEVQNTSVGSGYVGAYGGGYSSRTGPSCGALNSCLATKGYTVDKNGIFQAAPGTEVACIN
jgi:hypothetical protein